ncbi:hypothetical protein [Sphingomonas hankookensis]|uniref:Uncharacterized protein n=1 Tax=Sphingomonas hengshuiensis TaxID=1609977 RepID=A0A2W4ZDR5_9SPHN|nr:MAG: hypothetical protein DI632_07245 [Sphingomonas hengshuiensis]
MTHGCGAVARPDLPEGRLVHSHGDGSDIAIGMSHPRHAQPPSALPNERRCIVRSEWGMPVGVRSEWVMPVGTVFRELPLI